MKLIEEIQKEKQHMEWWLLVDRVAGNELCFYYLYHVIVSAKYHRAFMTTILIAVNFFVASSLSFVYLQP